MSISSTTATASTASNITDLGIESADQDALTAAETAAKIQKEATQAGRDLFG